MKLPTSSILIHERQRIDLGDITDLADSISRLGQAQDILVKDNYNGTYDLIAGRRRLAACTLLQCDVHARPFTPEQLDKYNVMSDHEKYIYIQELELEEDTKRKDRTWQERILAYRKLHRLKKLTEDKWGVKQLAELVDKSVGHVSEALQVAEALERTVGKTDEWSQRLWNSVSFFDACKHMMGRNEDLCMEELNKRKRAALEAQNLLKRPIQELNPTEEGEKAMEVKELIVPRKVQWNKRFPEQDECKAMLVFNDVYESFGVIHPEGCGMLWFSTLEEWQQCIVAYKKLDYECINFPIIWNTVVGRQTPLWPVQQSYQLGLFVWRSGYKSPFQTPRPAVFTEHNNHPEDFYLSYSKVVGTMLDLISVEGDKIWMPNGGPVVDVYRHGRIPVWQNMEDEPLMAHFHQQFGKNVQFVI